MEECNICAEKFNFSNRKQVNCLYCKFEACRKCCQSYILNKELSVCMNVNKDSNGEFICQKPWNRKFMTENFPNTWIKNEWTKMTKKVGFEKEKALLPATMPEILRKREEEKKHKEIEDIHKEIQKLYKKQQELRTAMYNDRYGAVTQRQENQFKGRKCADETCRGYLSSQWKCGVCDMWTCSQCHKLKGLQRDSQHICNPDDIATANLLNRDTKNCPSCSTPIFKISGCDQMWCTECHTAFSWRTGAIQTRVIHNPHYFEWQRRNNNGNIPRNPGDVECGRELYDSRALLSIREIIRSLNISQLKEYEHQIENIIRGTIHLDRVDSLRFHTNQQRDNIDIRIQYLENQIAEKDFCSLILRREKASEKKQDIYNVIRLIVTANTDIIYRLESEIKNVNTDRTIDKEIIKDNIISVCEKHINEVKHITDYCNNLLREHRKTYGCKIYRLNFHLHEHGAWHHVLT